MWYSYLTLFMIVRRYSIFIRHLFQWHPNCNGQFFCLHQFFVFWIDFRICVCAVWSVKSHLPGFENPELFYPFSFPVFSPFKKKCHCVSALFGALVVLESQVNGSKTFSVALAYCRKRTASSGAAVQALPEGDRCQDFARWYFGGVRRAECRKRPPASVRVWFFTGSGYLVL